MAAQSASVDGYRLIGYGSYSLDARTDVSVQADFGTGHNEGQRKRCVTASPTRPLR
ncbi:hypothetical protein AB4Z48_02075 [Cupriavidus sp. 2TAF22]|uniref:hypothetical protein n=1 Tax=unclassified Cupriavidus TaxID=2640874 RepID=UPI003F8F1380